MGTFQFDKGLPGEISSITAKMDDVFDVVFEQMVYFRQELELHSGKAANKMQKNMEEDIDFFSKASFSLMTFVETTKRFVTAVDEVDEGNDGSSASFATRAERQYEYSPAKAMNEIVMDPLPLEEATDGYASNLEDLDEMLTEFSEVLDNIIDNTKFPWAAVDEIWPDAKEQITFVINEFQDRVQKMMKESWTLIEELERVDSMISAQMLELNY